MQKQNNRIKVRTVWRKRDREIKKKKEEKQI